MLEQLGINAKKVAGILTTVTTEQKNNALIEISNALLLRADEIIKANEEEKESDADTDSGSDKNTLPPPIPEDEKNDK